MKRTNIPLPDAEAPVLWLYKYDDGIDTRWYVERPAHGDIGAGSTPAIALTAAIRAQRHTILNLERQLAQERAVFDVLEDALTLAEAGVYDGDGGGR